MEKYKNPEALRIMIDEFGNEETNPVESNTELIMDGDNIILKTSVRYINQNGQTVTENTINNIALDWVIDAAVREGCREQILQKLQETSESEEIIETESLS